MQKFFGDQKIAQMKDAEYGSKYTSHLISAATRWRVEEEEEQENDL